MVTETVMGGGAAPERIQTARLLLRRFEERDRADMVRFYGDPEVMGIRKYGPREEEAASAAFDILLGHWREHGFGLYAVVETASGALAGECGLRYTDERQEIEISYGLFPDFRGHGYMSEAATAVRDMGLGPMGLDGFVARSRGDNRVSHHILEKLGMRLVDREQVPGHDHGVVKYVIAR